MHKKIKIMIILISIACVINLAFDAFLIYKNHLLQQKYQKVVNEYVPHAEDLYKLSGYMYKMHSLTFSEIASQSEANPQHHTDAIESLDNKIHQTLISYSTFSQDKEEQLLLQRLYSSYANYYSQLQTSLQLSKTSVERALYYINSTMESKMDIINSTLGEINVIVDKNISQGKEDLRRSDMTSNILTICMGVSLIILVLILIIALRRNSSQLIHLINKEIRTREHKIIHMQSKTIEGMAGLVESRDGETGAHVRNTAYFVELIAQKLAEDSPYKDNMTPEYISLLKRYAPLHDVGKIVISDAILLKPARLTKDEFELMKQHTVEGGSIIDNILSDIETPDHIQIARDIAVHHHEKWDGSGYPSHLAGEDIPLCARIMSVADVFDALISRRCYKDAFSLDEAYAIIRDSEGSQFDPVVVKAFFSAQPKIEAYISQSSQKNAPAV